MSTTTWCPMDARQLASGAAAVLDHRGRVLRIVPAGPDADAELDAAAEHERTCNVCDAVGHAYVVGWETDDDGASRPLIGGGPCPTDGLGPTDPRDF